MTEFLAWYGGIVEAFTNAAPGKDKFVHLCVGMAIWIEAAIFLGKPLKAWTPLLIVALAEFGNETLDRLTHGSWRWTDTLGDIYATLFWPTLLMGLLRAAPFLANSPTDKS
ncbi:hypothetical protein PYV00_11060 [Novosphingobium sp. H3SJ31-1]|uniref:VanZ-like domain-containing protein n=1 Tax=Novosphingobium album (ex Liu et al. 2023) TaxID=3031130 RepID=A0ABT5WQD4_9SPHN|nr:hypothetical protein [Novosphingobium album (ex Liu et al. 2023)]